MSESSMPETRPRCYSFPPDPGTVNPVAAHLLGALDEVTARHADLIRDLDGKVLDVRPPGTPFTIAQITAHMVDAEVIWITALRGTAPPAALRETCSMLREAPSSPLNAAQLIDLCSLVRNDHTVPYLRSLGMDIDTPIAFRNLTISTRGVLTHLVWHWIYHNGQCGVLRMQAGLDYDWRFDGCVTGHPPRRS